MYECMYVCMYINIVLIYIYMCMIKFMVMWCTCSMWRMLLPCGKLIGLLFCLLLLFLLSILFLKPKYVHTKKLQGMRSLALQWEPFF